MKKVLGFTAMVYGLVLALLTICPAATFAGGGDIGFGCGPVDRSFPSVNLEGNWKGTAKVFVLDSAQKWEPIGGKVFIAFGKTQEDRWECGSSFYASCRIYSDKKMLTLLSDDCHAYIPQRGDHFSIGFYWPAAEGYVYGDLFYSPRRATGEIDGQTWIPSGEWQCQTNCYFDEFSNYVCTDSCWEIMTLGQIADGTISLKR